MNISLKKHIAGNIKIDYIILSIISFLIPIIGLVYIMFYLMSNINKPFNSNDKYLTVSLALLFATFGYSITWRYGIESDLTKYLDELPGYINMSFIECFDDSEMLYTRNLLFHIIANFQDVHILPYIVGLLVYSMVFYVIYDVIIQSRKVFTKKEVLMLMIIAIGCTSPYAVIGNVRCILAYVIITFATYRDMVQKRRNFITIILYIIPLGLHTAAISILFVRLFQYFVKFFGKSILFVAIFFPLFINIANEYQNYFYGFLRTFIRKAYFYLNWTDEGYAAEVDKTTFYYIGRISGTFFILIQVIITIIYDNKKTNSIFQLPMTRFLFLIAAYALGSLYIKTGAFWRFTALFAFFSPCVMVPALETESPTIKALFRLLFLGMVLMVILHTVHLFMGEGLDFWGTTSNYLGFSGFKIFNFFYN